MNETKKRVRKAQTYSHKKNAVSVTVYSPTGDTIPAEARDEIENSVWEVASKHRLLINIAYE
jgi:hypothetical protein